MEAIDSRGMGDHHHRSIAMLPACHPPGMNKEAAIHAVDEVRRLLARERQLIGILNQVRALLVDFDR